MKDAFAMIRTPTMTTRAAASCASLAGLFAISACATVEVPGDAPLYLATSIEAELSGANEVPELGDPDGEGRFVAEIEEDGRLCYAISAANIAPVTGAHIHEGASDVNGKVVVDLIILGPDMEVEACTNIEPSLASQIVADPSAFYVNLHNEPYPGGAIRGQLR
jgi:hypothetical protein